MSAHAKIPTPQLALVTEQLLRHSKEPQECETAITTTSIDGLILLRNHGDRQLQHTIHQPTLCMVIQGAKQTSFGQTHLTYRAGQGLLINVDMPGNSKVIESSPESPYLSLVMMLNLTILGEVFAQLPAPTHLPEIPQGASVIDLDGPLLDCALRALRLLDTPHAIPLLYPAIVREICYWLLSNPCGPHITRAVLDTLRSHHTGNIARAIHTLRQRFAEPVRIQELADVACLSQSAFHRHFKETTSMSPLQYQKQLRLLEARRLMLVGECNAEAAAFRVGYESPSQFSREYARMFGQPPKRDISALQK